jgi:H+/gluconate symporter-like permease
MLANLGLLFSLGLLIWLVLRGVNVILASLLAAIAVALTNGLPLSESLLQHYATGRSGAFSFAGQFFLIFFAGAIFGKVMAEGKATTSIALLFRDLLGRERVLWIIMLACALLTYGGVVVFVVIFAVYPLALELARDANTPKRLLAGAAALGAGTFTMTALPGTPSIHNVIAARALGTDLFAAPLLGLVAAGLMVLLGMGYLERERRRAVARGEGFEAAPHEHVPDDEELAAGLPHWGVALAPLLVVLAIIISRDCSRASCRRTMSPRWRRSWHSPLASRSSGRAWRSRSARCSRCCCCRACLPSAWPASGAAPTRRSCR